MSTPPTRRDRRPLNERSQSQNNKLGIRIVPYSPPRLSAADSEGRAPSRGSSRAQTTGGRSLFGKYDDHLVSDHDPDLDEEPGTSLAEAPQSREGISSSHGSTWSSPSVHSLSLDRAKDSRVSAAKPAPGSSGEEDVGPGAPTATVLQFPSEKPDATIIPRDTATPQFASAVTEPTHHHDERSPSASADLSALAHASAPKSESASASASPPPSTASSPTAAHQPRPLSRRRNFVAVHADKTFSLVRTGPRSDGSATASLKSPQLSYSSRTSTTQERPSIDAWSEDQQNSPLTTGPSATPTIPFTSPGASSLQLAEDPITSSPWNYRMVGGLRKVAKTPDLKQKLSSTSTTSTASGSTLLAAKPSSLAPLAEYTVYRDETNDDDNDDNDDSSSRQLVPKASFASAQTASTTSETTNYKVYGHSSSPEELSTDNLLIPVASTENYEILSRSSPAGPTPSSPPGTADSQKNFVLHGDPSPAPSSVDVALVPREPRPTYSQESLRVPPLRPVKKRSNEAFGYYKQRSRESLRTRTGSIKSLKGLPAVISQETAQSSFVAPVLINFGASSSRSAREGGPGSSRQQQQQEQQPQLEQRPQQFLTQGPSWSAAEESSSSSSSSPLARNPVSQPPPFPPAPMNTVASHKWSSQLSTVMSESEGGSEDGPSRSISPVSVSGSGSGPESHRRRSSAGWAGSMHSRQIQSISSSLAAQLEDSSNSRSDSSDRPTPTYGRGGPSGIRTVRDQDEHGDGLTDLQNLSPHPSRSGLSGFFTSGNSSSRNLHSSGSSRANSLTSASIPAWARVYYGSGERKFLGAPSISTFTDESRPTSSIFQGSSSPNTDHFPLSIYSPRRRPREINPPAALRPFSDSASLDIAPMPHPSDLGVIRTLRKKTSSIWSPHLGVDRRATRYSIWEPPSVSWSADSGSLGKRNVQVILFIAGFIFPFAWMIAALLPLPANPNLQILETGDNSSRSQLGQSNSNSNSAQMYKIKVIDETRYQSARWWRNLNRVMSIVGLIIIGVVVALVVVGVRQGWVVTRTSSS